MMESLMSRRTYRRDKGLSLVEFAAALALGFPMIVTMLYAVIEANMLFTIRTNCDNAVRQAAQLLINDYEKTGTAATDTTNGNLPSSLQFDIKTADGHYFVYHAANQFTWTWDFTDRPNTLTVTVNYPTSGFGNFLLAFPHPDPLNLKKNIPNFSITTTGTFSVPPTN
jgi:Tfp pilus assembly protein PilW